MNISSYTKGSQAQSVFEFYVLSKGVNAGRPMSRPWSSCIKVKAGTETERNRLYGYTYVLWKTERFESFIKEDSQILKLEDYQRILQATMESPNIDHVRMQNIFKHVRSLQNRQAALMNTIRVLKSVESAFIRKCVRL